MNLKHKYVIAAAAALLSSSNISYANFYTGAGFGIRPLSANFTKLVVTGVGINNLDESVTKPAGDLFVGYDHVFRSGLYVGSEAFYEYVNMDVAVSATVQAFGVTIDERVSASLDSNFGISALLGYKSHNADIFYGRFGLLFDELHYKAESRVGNTTDASTKGQHYAGAIQLGLGITHPFNRKWSVRGEYTYTRYPNVGVNINMTVPVAGNTSVVSFTPKVSINAATISLIYSFA